MNTTVYMRVLMVALFCLLGAMLLIAYRAKARVPNQQHPEKPGVVKPGTP